jgi:hypothetical protein
MKNLKKGDWIAVVTRNGETPVGEVIENKDGVMTIELISALFKWPMDQFKIIHHEDVTDYAVSLKKDGWYEGKQLVIEDHHLWAFQTKWSRRLRDK